jgi:hypothetical protein
MIGGYTIYMATCGSDARTGMVGTRLVLSQIPLDFLVALTRL